MKKISSYLKPLLIDTSTPKYASFPNNLKGEIYLETRQEGEITLLVTVGKKFLDDLMQPAIDKWIKDKTKPLSEHLLENKRIIEGGYTDYIKQWMEAGLIE